MTPSFSDLRNSSCGAGNQSRTWSAVVAELQLIFPTLPSGAWDAITPKTSRGWLNSASTVYANDPELIVWLPEYTTCSGAHNSNFPESGRGVYMNGGGMSAQRYKLAHELGHHLGVSHTFDNDSSPDPETLVPRTLADQWDLVYKPGTSSSNPHVYYSSKSAAAADLASLQNIHVRNPIDNCTDLGAGQLSCVIGSGAYTETWTTGSTALKGMAFAFASGQGPNIMSYRGDYSTHSYAISDSQIQLARKYLRWDVPLAASTDSVIRDGWTGSGPLSGERPRLGNWDVRDPTYMLDFDLDFKRDIGVWISVDPAELDGIDGPVHRAPVEPGLQSDTGYLHERQLRRARRRAGAR